MTTRFAEEREMLTQQEILQRFTFTVMNAHVTDKKHHLDGFYTISIQENGDGAVTIDSDIRALLFRDLSASHLMAMLSIVIDDEITHAEAISRILSGTQQVALVRGEL